MTKPFLPLAILLLAPLFTHAQARPECALKPKTLTQMRRCYRPLLVFSPSATDARLIKQQSELDEAADDMMDRFVLFVPVLTKSSKLPAAARHALRAPRPRKNSPPSAIVFRCRKINLRSCCSVKTALSNCAAQLL